MKYFITGMSGFIGSNLARQLATDGHKINAIIRNPAANDLLDLPDIQLFKGDLQDRHVLREAMDGCDMAFHLAAFAKPWSKDPGECRRINVEGTINVFDAAMECGLKRVVFTSSAATMSPSEGRLPVSESTPRTVPFFNDYEITKTKAEQISRAYCDKGLEVVIVNPSRVYGPGPLNPSNSVTRMIAGYYRGTWKIIPGNGRKIGNYVFIDDVVYGHLLAARKGRPGERYILGGQNISFDELFQILERVTGKSHRMFHLPVSIMTLAAKLMELQTPVTGIPPLITAAWVKKYLNHWSLTSDKAIRELGYQITPFEEGAHRTIEWIINKEVAEREHLTLGMERNVVPL
jgi:nucleoside-diphosphate-sugar epimerase